MDPHFDPDPNAYSNRDAYSDTSATLDYKPAGQ